MRCIVTRKESSCFLHCVLLSWILLHLFAKDYYFIYTKQTCKNIFLRKRGNSKFFETIPLVVGLWFHRYVNCSYLSWKVHLHFCTRYVLQKDAEGAKYAHYCPVNGLLILHICSGKCKRFWERWKLLSHEPGVPCSTFDTCWNLQSTRWFRQLQALRLAFKYCHAPVAIFLLPLSGARFKVLILKSQVFDADISDNRIISLVEQMKELKNCHWLFQGCPKC